MGKSDDQAAWKQKAWQTSTCNCHSTWWHWGTIIRWSNELLGSSSDIHVSDLSHFFLVMSHHNSLFSNVTVFPSYLWTMWLSTNYDLVVYTVVLILKSFINWENAWFLRFFGRLSRSPRNLAILGFRGQISYPPFKVCVPKILRLKDHLAQTLYPTPLLQQDSGHKRLNTGQSLYVQKGGSVTLAVAEEAQPVNRWVCEHTHTHTHRVHKFSSTQVNLQ